MIIFQKDILNCTPTPEELTENFLTPQSRFFVRSHGILPSSFTESTYRVSVSGLVSSEAHFTLEELQQNFETVEQILTIQCAGNRRAELNDLKTIPEEVLWNNAAISTARWTGVRLKDILVALGMDESAKHLEFLGADIATRENKETPFGASVPIEKVLAGDVLLALALNGEPLTLAHGAPLRVVIAGYYGARSVKWLSHIIARHDESPNFFQQRSYKVFEPTVNYKTADWSRPSAISVMPINSTITYVERTSSGEVTLKGYAIVGDDTIQAVEVSFDEGNSWHNATLTSEVIKSVWVFWEYRASGITQGTSVIVRAKDSQNRTQPAALEEVWNFKGYQNNAYHRMTL